MSILKLKPSGKDYIWGGHRLVEEYGKQWDKDILAETWELSCHPDGPSTIINGEFAGMTLQQYIDTQGKQVLGNNCKRFEEFPILIKFIDAKDNLSIQVHPNNNYALKNEGQYGKTEMWYVMDAKEGAYLYYGFKKEISKEELERRIKEDTLLEVLNQVPVKKGDVLFIEAGTIHAIGKDILIAEIQQNSNITYRVYDYGRVGTDGKKRELHIEKALEVTNRIPIVQSGANYPHVASCDYFTVDKLNLDGVFMKKMEGVVSEDSFLSMLVLDGERNISCGEECVSFQKGDSLFLSAGSGAYTVEGNCDALITTIRKKEHPIRIGVDLGGSFTKIGLVDERQQLIATKTIDTQVEHGWKEMIKEIGLSVLQLLEENNISMEQCVSVGVGIPGTIDIQNGVVVYSNNINWVNVPFTKELQAYLPLPIYIANDADCAVLGEFVAGVAKGYEDVVMLTLGTGVGSGIVWNGSMYKGKKLGGNELGHMVICQGGESCTCGRKGCLEAYASATALKRCGKLVYKREIEPEELFKRANSGDEIAKHIITDYVEKLGIGIINIANMLNPQIIVLGGGISKQGEMLLKPLRKLLQENYFGGKYVTPPKLELATLGNCAGIIGAANL